MKKLKDMTVKQLKSDYLKLYNQIEIVDCFGTKDIIRYQAIAQELEKRGYEIQEGQPTFVKKDEEENEVTEDKDRKNGLYGPEYKGERF